MRFSTGKEHNEALNTYSCYVINKEKAVFILTQTAVTRSVLPEASMPILIPF